MCKIRKLKEGAKKYDRKGWIGDFGSTSSID